MERGRSLRQWFLGVLFLLSSISLPSESTGQDQQTFGVFLATEGQIQAVARTGDPAPGGGTFVFFHGRAGLNESGTVAFAAALADGSWGIFRASSGQIQAVARTGDPAPGGGTFRRLGFLDLNDMGAVAFWADLEPEGLENGIFLAQGSEVRAIARRGDPASGSCGTTFLIFGFESVRLNNRGEVTFTAIFENPTTFHPVTGWPCVSGLFLASGGKFQKVMQEGDPGPEGGLFADRQIGIRVTAINDAGQVAFASSIGPIQSLFLAVGGSVRFAVRSGDPAPGGGTFFFVREPGLTLNSGGALVFIGEFSPVNSDFQGVYLRRASGELAAIARSGDPAPGGGRFGLPSGFSFLSRPGMNDRGEIVFVAIMDEAASGLFPFANGLFRFANGDLAVLAMTGDPAPRGGAFALFSEPNINDRGMVAFHAIVEPAPLLKILDPVPDLLDGPAVTSNVAILAQQGREVRGVAADGVTQAVLRVTPPEAGTVELTLVDDAGMPLADLQEGGFLAHIGASVGSNGLSVPTVDVPGKGPMAFALYRAPGRFVRAGSMDTNVKERQVSIRIRFVPQGGGRATEVTAPITIARPPVVLVHGLWASHESWDLFAPLNTDPRFFVRPVNYRATNAAGFAVNTPIVGRQIESRIRNYKNATQVAAVQADVVTHSMGGLLTRRLPLLGSAYFREDNFQQGHVHKLINIGSPHFGSELAEILRTKIPNARCRIAFSTAGIPIHRGAIEDLSPESTSLRELNRLGSPLRQHNSVGIASVRQREVNASGALLDGVQSPLICGQILPPGGFDALFRDNSDLLVSATSQRARLNPTLPAVSTFAPLIHTTAGGFFDVADGAAELESAQVSQQVIELLSLSLEEAKFVRLPPQ